jgi:hypothetical protein
MWNKDSSAVRSIKRQYIHQSQSRSVLTSTTVTVNPYASYPFHLTPHVAACWQAIRID